MSEKAPKRLLVAAAVALLVYSTLGIYRRVEGSMTSGSAGFARVLQAVDTATLQTIRMVGPADSIELKRVGDTWIANGFATDQDQVARLLDAVARANVGQVSATNPSNHAQLGVTEADAWRIQFEDIDERRTEILLGKTGVRFGSAFARIPGEETVVTLVGDLRPSVVKSLDAWRDKTVALTDTAAVETISIRSRSSEFRLRRRGAQWLLGSATADSFSVAALLQELAQVEAVGFADPEIDLGGERRTLVALAANGDTLTQLDGWIGEGAFHVRAPSDGEPVTYELSAWRADRLMPPADSIRAR